MNTVVKSLLLLLFLFVICYIGFYLDYNKHKYYESLDKTTIDSIINNNKILIIEVKRLDSIKNENIIKVKELDNDSTLKLFYELLGK